MLVWLWGTHFIGRVFIRRGILGDQLQDVFYFHLFGFRDLGFSPLVYLKPIWKWCFEVIVEGSGYINIKSSSPVAEFLYNIFQLFFFFKI